ncbi:CPBP family intramembrane metalloprotease [Pontibacillus yanchengensis]|uniref:CPBP family intramembrane metalloprotease n=1 Tax=Pontibacillus yanchengensis TaxID=462910 RepID=A0ACC7VJF8_9BACI|nr:CPBP family intramembrane glutamic endopeptidase [Pontibacillus yanchengensis]MYL55103.1 CPBP family intramembrane metalloprotease [Pontibacillus yanchengensis]
MKWTNQAELIKQLTDRQLVNQVYLTQLIILILTIGGSFFLFDSLEEVADLFRWNTQQVIFYGISAGVVVLIIDIILMVLLPARFYDDGGINKRVFRSISVLEIFVIALLVAFAEELLFRGVIHTHFGYIIASVLFALMHVRYLTKPVLFVSVLFISFYFGWMYEITHLLWVTIIAHFMVDFVLGVMIRFNVMR